MNNNILITGGTGFIGSNLINFFKDDYKFINIGRNKNKLCENIQWNLKDNLPKKLNININTVIHCASIVGNDMLNKSDYIDINVKSTLNLIEYCLNNGVKRFIYISTGGVYGYNEQEATETDQCNPIDIYSLSKYFSEQLCGLYKDKLSIVILRLFFPYGNQQKNRLISNLISSIIQKRNIVLNKLGLPVINPIHIFDVVNILRGIIENDFTGVFNVSGNEQISIEGLCRKISLLTNINDLNIVYNESEFKNLVGSNKKICELLNYSMKIDLDTGIKNIINENIRGGTGAL